MRIASIDVGTNTFRILVGEPKGNNLEKLYVDRVITRLGGGFRREEKLISESAVRRALAVLKRFAVTIREYDVEEVRAVATSVVRESLNGHAFIERVKNETGIEIELISGEEEAKLTVSGVLKSVSPDSKSCVIFDVGGGSTEYAYVREGVILGLRSTGLGVVHLSENFLKGDVPSDLDVKMLSENIENVLSYELSRLPNPADGGLCLVATAGTPTTLAAIELGLDKYDASLVNGFLLNRGAVLRIFEALIKIPKEKRLEVRGLERGREDVIIPGALILLKTMESFSSDRVLVSDGGLLEGVAYSMIA